MLSSKLRSFNPDGLARIAVWLVLLAGIVLRLVLFFQNRNLIIDEANIVRNLYERSFIELLFPLKYEQYAPPVFLWVEELASLLFGYGEKAMRLYPLLCGIASLFLFRAIMKPLVRERSLWMPMAMMACTYLLIKYSVEMKQYMPDAFIALLLVYIAQRRDVEKLSPWKLFAWWVPIGVVAILSSMPSVFMLASVGCYLMLQAISHKKWNYLLPLMLTGTVWLGVFAAYYFTILKPQVESEYLQNYHADYFLYATPANGEEWNHNWMRIKEIIENMAGYSGLNFVLSLLLLLTGTIAMLRKKPQLYVLVMLPVGLTLLAAMLNQFSLIDRVVLFLLPLLLVVYGYGFEQLFHVKWKAIRVVWVIIGIAAIQSFNMFWLFQRKLGFHEITDGMDYLVSKNVRGDKLFIHDASTPTYIYYTEMHPEKQKYATLLDAHKMKWDSDYVVETKDVKDTVYFLYTGGFGEGEKTKRMRQIEQNLKQVDYHESYISFVYGYAPKVDTTAPANP